METVATNSNIETDATNSNMETDATNTNFVEPAKLSNPSQLVTEQDHEQPGPSGILHETHKSIVVSDSAPKYQPQVQASTSNDFSSNQIIASFKSVIYWLFSRIYRYSKLFIKCV